MSELLRKYLLSTAAAFAPRGGRDGAAAQGDPADDPQDDPQDDPADDPQDDPQDDPADDPQDDAAQDDDAQGDPPDDRGELRTQDEPVQRGRAAGRIQRVTEENRELKRRLDEMEQRSNAREAPAPQQRQMTPQEEQALLATMTVEERMEYRTNKLLQAQQQQNNQLFSGMRDQTDRAAFGAKLIEKPHLKKFEQEVETRYQRCVREGGYLPREAILIYVLGEKAYAAQTGAQRQEASNRVRRQQTRPANGRGDAQSQRRSGGKSLEDRLENVPL